MADCRQNVLPYVLVGRCVDPTKSFGPLFPSSNGAPALPFPIIGQPGRNTTSKTNNTITATEIPFPAVKTATTLSTQSGGINALTTPPINVGLGAGNPFAGIDIGSAFSGINIPGFGSSLPATNRSTNSTNSTGNGFVLRPPSTGGQGGQS